MEKPGGAAFSDILRIPNADPAALFLSSTRHDRDSIADTHITRD